MVRITKRQNEVLQFLKNYIAENGFPPTVSEIARGFGWKSGNAAAEHLEALSKKGYIQIASKKARGIKVLR